MRLQSLFAGLTLMAAVALAISGCSPSHNTTPSIQASVAVVATTTPTTTVDSQGQGLVAPEHTQCDFGPQLLHYLQTGDNGGDPRYDQLFAADVGSSIPQSRAIADKAINDCDQQLDTQASQAQQDEIKASQSAVNASEDASAAAVAAALEQQRIRSCQFVGGTYESGPQLCQSKVNGSSTGEYPIDCSYSSVSFTDQGYITAEDMTKERKSYPGCWP